MSLPIRARLYPKQGSSGLIKKVKNKIDGFAQEDTAFSKATSALQNTPYGQFVNGATNSNLLENMANRGVNTFADTIANGIGDTFGRFGGSVGGIVGGELGALTSDRLSAFLQGALGNKATDWYSGPAYVLAGTNGLTFPTTPTISTSHTANYDDYDLTHSNYSAMAYKNSKVEDIQITAKFPINSRQEADYYIGAMHFLRSVTKSHFGEFDDNKGVPPPVLLFDAMGTYAFNAVPVVVKSFNESYEDIYDYVVSSSGTYVPTLITMQLTLSPYFEPSATSKEFSLGEFREGKLINRGYI